MIQIETVDRMKPGQLVQHYLLASFCYYHMSQSPMTDQAFDRLCVRLSSVLPTVQHPHAKLINPDDVSAGSCFLREDQFPRMVRNSADKYAEACITGELVRLIEPHLAPRASSRIMRRPVAAAPARTPEPAPRRIMRRPAPPQETAAPPPRRIMRKPK